MANYAPSASETVGATVLVGANEFAAIGRDITVTNINGTGTVIEAVGSNSFISNEGSILAYYGAGVGELGTLYNRATGTITGYAIGVYYNGSGSTAVIDNAGEIFGGGVAIYDFFGGLTLRNSGTIVSGEGAYLGAYNAAIRMTGGGSSSIVNSGTIRAMRAGGEAIEATGTTVQTVVNSGSIIGDIELQGGNDRYAGTAGRLTGKLFAGDGLDIVTGGALADWFEGGNQNDTLTGNGGNDTLKGDAGADALNGGLGKDILTGGTEADRFVFSAKTHSVVGANADRITDFDDGSTGDRIDLSALFGPGMTYRHSVAFTAAGQVRINDVAGADVVVEVNTGGSLAPDFSIRLVNTTLASMNAGDFVL